MASAPRIDNFSDHGPTGNIESRRYRGESNIKNEIWRNKWYPNKTVSNMKNIQAKKSSNKEAYGAQLFIKLRPTFRRDLIDMLRANPLLLKMGLPSLLPQLSRSEQNAIILYLANNRAAILADPRLQGGAVKAYSGRTKKLRHKRRKTRH
jgi:hypothetical protein